MKKLIILVDLDSTVADLCTPWYDVYNRRFGDDLCMERVTDWDTSKFAKHGLAIFGVLSDPGLFLNLKPLPGALEACKALAEDGHRLIVVSAVPAGSVTGGYEKKQWVWHNMPFINRKDVIITDAKDVIEGDVLIDDGPHNIIAWGARHPRAYIATIAYPYNSHAHAQCNLVAGDYTDPAAAWARILEGVREYASPNIKPQNVDGDGREVT